MGGIGQTIQLKAMEWAIPLVAGPLALIATQYAKRLSGWLDTAHPAIKQGVVLGFAALLNYAMPLVGDAMCTVAQSSCTLETINWKFVVSFALATALHGWKKKPT